MPSRLESICIALHTLHLDGVFMWIETTLENLISSPLHARERSDSTLEYNSILNDCEFLMFFDALWWKCSYLAHTCVHIWHRGMGRGGRDVGNARSELWFLISHRKERQRHTHSEFANTRLTNSTNITFYDSQSISFWHSISLLNPRVLTSTTTSSGNDDNNISVCGRSWWERGEAQAHQRGGGGEQAKR